MGKRQISNDGAFREVASITEADGPRHKAEFGKECAFRVVGGTRSVADGGEVIWARRGEW